jgi:alkanesulfonate monooxygenase SsuD/methylene tetrahydromethanopterin reductase-like flavin-dependent oxidoreductase (luciferase family)
MSSAAAPVDAARHSLGPVGAYLPVPFTSAPPVDLQREAVGRLERAGYRTAWVNETLGGYTEQQVSQTSDDLVKDLVAHGDPDSIAAAVAAHRAAGADHVILMPPGAAASDLAAGVGHLEHLAPAVLQVN